MVTPIQARAGHYVVGHLERLGLVQEITGWQRNWRYRYGPFLELFERDRVPELDLGPLQTTEALPN
jgi:hypothetical protein